MMSPRTREKVVQQVGDAIARRRPPTLADGRPTPVLAEGTAPVPVPVDTTRLPRRSRRLAWVAGAAVVAMVGTLGYAQLSTDGHRAQLEADYPIVATAAEHVVLEREAERWTAGRERLLASLAAFEAPAVDAMAGVGACPLAAATVGATDTDDAATIDPDAAITTQLVLLPGEQLTGLDVVARPELDAMLAAAERGRFRTAAARDHVLAALSGAFVVAHLDTYTASSATGTAYAFDPRTGELRCSGTFQAQGDARATERAILGALRAVRL